MSRIATRFEVLRRQGRKALIPYITAGDPAREVTVPLMHALAAAGADVIELGVPFSDPMADGQVIQLASERALARGVGLADVLAWVSEFRRDDNQTPVVLMGYANPVERCDQRHGAGGFVAACVEAGVDGVLVVDYPPEESAEFAAALRAQGLDPIYLLAPTSTEARIETVGRVASGYVYYVSLKGVTGAGHLDIGSVREAVPRIRAHVDVPVGVGFGIRDAASARAVAEVADAVVIGSRLVQLLHEAAAPDVVATGAAFIASMREAIDAASVRESKGSDA